MRMTIEEALRHAAEACAGRDFVLMEQLCRAVLAARPDIVEARYNLGIALHAQRRLAEALDAYGECIARRPSFADAYNNRGVVQRELGRMEEALADYDRALALDPAASRAHNNRGVVLRALRRFDAALASYTRAIEIDPGFAEAHCNRGSVLADLGRLPEALESQERAIAASPGHVDAWVRRGVALTDLRHHGAAAQSLRRALDLDPTRDWVEGLWLQAKLRICDWHGFEEHLAHLTARIARGERASLPFPCLLLVDSPALHRQCAAAWADAWAASGPLAPAPVARERPARLHIGYFSADFHEHATAYLMAGVLEQHDRAAFEVTAFSFGPRTGDPMQLRMAHAVERFVDVRERSDDDVVRLARELHVDIAVDLKGYTDHARTAIFAARAAPVQVNYLGYPGTMAAPFMDVVLADRTVVPEDSQGDYTERVAYLPGCYQVNDAVRAVDATPTSRAAQGLPAEGFVYCCFNNSFKILPAVFEGWMRVLERVPGSVLWLLADDPLAADNLRREASRRGIDEARLVFAERIAQGAHMARLPLADAFLDTFPYNAHTTASDALWSGVPLVTRAGQSFASRVAASLLQEVGLPELVAATREDYEALAVRLASDAAWRGDIRARLASARHASGLFDPRRHARELEAAYVSLARGSMPASARRT